MTKQQWLGHLYLVIGALIYGANHSIAKLAMPEYLSPQAFVLTRSMGALVFFWTISFFLPPQKPERKDWFGILICAMFGIAFNQLLFFLGLNLTAPIYSGIIMTSSPIFVLILSYFFLSQQILLRQVIGVGIGVIGVVILLVFAQASVKHQAPYPALGNSLILMNSLFYSIYIVASKSLLVKYNPIHFLKWIVTIGFFLQLPFAWRDWLEVEWTELPPKVVFAVFEVVVLISCVVYLLNLMALQRLRATTVSAYIFAQPLIAGAFALAMGKDQLDIFKVIGALLILLGVYLVSIPIKNKRKWIKS